MYSIGHPTITTRIAVGVLCGAGLALSPASADAAAHVVRGTGPTAVYDASVADISTRCRR